MRLRLASKTAAYLAFLRAIASNRPPEDRLFYDPYAHYFLPAFLKLLEKLSKIPSFNKRISTFIDKRWAGAFTSCMARTRLIDVMTIKTIQDEGINQLITFGPGYDCRMHRLEFPAKVIFVEIDHPDIQQKKINILQNARPKTDTIIDYIPVDFTKQQLETTIPHHLLKPHYKNLILWEGVTNSLTLPIADQLFSYFSHFGSGTVIIFIYVDEKVLALKQSFLSAENVSKLLRHHHEFWNFSIAPSRLPEFLNNYKMDLLYDFDADTYRHSCFGDKADELRGYDYYRVVMAVVR